MADLKTRFRSLDRARPPDLWPDIMERAPDPRLQSPAAAFSSPRLAILVAALLLLGLLVAGIVGGILRDDPDDRTDLTDRAPFVFAGPISRPCDDSLPDHVVLRIRGNLGTEAPYPVERTVYADGLVVDGVTAEWGGSFNTIDATWSARRLEASAAEVLVESVTGSVPSCRSFPFDGFVTIQARDADGVHVIGLGPDPFEARVPTADESSAVALLVDQLLDRELGIPSTGWADANWLPYQPDRWRFSLTFSPAGERSMPPGDDTVLPDGSSLRTFGGDDAVVDELGVRCVVRSTEEATAIASVLTEAMGELAAEMSGTWQFADDQGAIYITAAGLLPHEPECVTEIPGLAPSTPVPAASAPTDGPPPLDACDYLDPGDVAELVGELAGEVEHHQGWSADWHMCWYPVETDALVLASSRRAIAGERAAEQAERLFGTPGVAADEVGGHQIFFNGCTATDGTCRSAVAISANQHFIVVTWGRGDRETLRLVAERVLAPLGAAE